MSSIIFLETQGYYLQMQRFLADIRETYVAHNIGKSKSFRAAARVEAEFNRKLDQELDRIHTLFVRGGASDADSLLGQYQGWRAVRGIDPDYVKDTLQDFPPSMVLREGGRATELTSIKDLLLSIQQCRHPNFSMPKYEVRERDFTPATPDESVDNIVVRHFLRAGKTAAQPTPPQNHPPKTGKKSPHLTVVSDEFCHHIDDLIIDARIAFISRYIKQYREEENKEALQERAGKFFDGAVTSRCHFFLNAVTRQIFIENGDKGTEAAAKARLQASELLKQYKAWCVLVSRNPNGPSALRAPYNDFTGPMKRVQFSVPDKTGNPIHGIEAFLQSIISDNYQGVALTGQLALPAPDPHSFSPATLMQDAKIVPLRRNPPRKGKNPGDDGPDSVA